MEAIQLEPHGLTQAAPQREHVAHSASGRPWGHCSITDCDGAAIVRRLGHYRFGWLCRPHYHAALRAFVDEQYAVMQARWGDAFAPEKGGGRWETT